ncbi:MAG TPA: NAD(P)-dependent oxidoreductase [Pirellulales bacterium]|jgi:nucleoside-diphosphate-sugar epimerase|nr:NAD(P)-dependent oxidoreductase [Pirellulales bacterium]
MKIAVTGATGFLGRYIVARLLEAGHDLRCWFRPASDREGFATTGRIEWQPGQLGDAAAAERLVAGCDAVVHAALDHPGGGFRGGEGELIGFVEANLVGTLRLMEAARAAGVSRFVFISTCAVHEKILDDRPLDETHPLWPTSHYGAHKAAVEKFIHSYGFGMGYPICALRPTGIYGVAHPVSESRWFDLVCRVVRGDVVTCSRGGKEVHAADVAKAVELLLSAAPTQIAGEAFNCCDGYISESEVANLAKELSGSRSQIEGKQTTPKHQIITEKLGALGMRFGGRELLRQTIWKLVDAAKAG